MISDQKIQKSCRVIMELLGNGLERGSSLLFYTPSATAKRLYYYPLCAGEFFCNHEYRVERERYDSFLVICVLDGELRQDDLTAKAGEALLVDCYRPHRYRTDTAAHTLWLHFDGGNSRTLFDEIVSVKGRKAKYPDTAVQDIRGLMGCKSETRQSETIFRILMGLLEAGGTTGEKMQSLVGRAKEYIREHYQEELTVAGIAGEVNLSPSYFSRTFRESTLMPPYDYLLSVRLEKAKELLLESGASVSETAYRCGFNSTSNFIYFFKKETGISPLQFRKIKY